MSISNISISQDNTTATCNLLAGHSPLVFIVDVDFEGVPPTTVKANVKDGAGAALASFNCIPYKDVIETQRQFVFIGDEFFRGLMLDFDDYEQGEETLEYVPNITKQFQLSFSDPENTVTSETIDLVIAHAARQFSENPCMVNIASNIGQIYIAVEDESVYVYFYNDNEANELSVNSGSFEEVIAKNYNDVEFVDWNDTPFKILI